MLKNSAHEQIHILAKFSVNLPFIPWSIAGVPSSQALPGFLITAPPPVLVPAVLGALAASCVDSKQKKIDFDARNSPSGEILTFKSPGKITTLWPLQISQVSTYHSQLTPTSPTPKPSHRLNSPQQQSHFLPIFLLVSSSANPWK